MAGMQFEYDEKGGTFYYFLLSFMALVLIPCTYYLWPTGKSTEDPEKSKKKCHCPGCEEKTARLVEKEPWKKCRRYSVKLAIIIGWILFCVVAYKASLVETDMSEFDPYQILGVDRGASVREVKKAYRQLTLTHHPDRGGDPVLFLKITKAHAALTDDEARKNWEEYGNPDGPGATHFGIALPKWIVEKQNSIWVLAVYGLVFMVILPVAVGTWWYRSIKFNSEQILMDTMHIYYAFFQQTPNMIIKRVIQILASSFEFDKRHNSEVVERPSDNTDLPRLMHDLVHLKKSQKTRPFCLPYSMKAQCLLHAHFMRVSLPANTLDIDRLYVVHKCPYLINEMVKVVSQQVAYARAGRTVMPRLETLENCMRLSPMVVQGLWENKSPLLQLPHITEDLLRHFVTRKRNIRSIRDFAGQPEDFRRYTLLQHLSNEEYADVMHVCSQMPYITMEVKSEVLDDEDKTIAAGDIVTVFVRLKREAMETRFNIEEPEDIQKKEEEPSTEDVEDVGPGGDAVKTQDTDNSPKKPKVWEKNKKKKGKGGKPKKKPAKQFVKRAPANAVVEKKEEDSPQPNGRVPKQKPDNSDDERGTDSQEEADSDQEDAEEPKESEQPADDGDDDEWSALQEETRKENMLDAKSKETHIVHCPYFPGVKYEWWWLYMSDRKQHLLITSPLQICSLRDEAEFQLKFCAPLKPGPYQYYVNLRSDSYLDFDLAQLIKFDVKEAKKVENHPQWDMSEDEEEKGDELSESEVTDDESTDDEA